MSQARSGGGLQTLGMKLEVIEDPSPRDRQGIVDRLVAWNLTVAPPEKHRKLVVVALEGDELIGGLVGHTHWNWLFVSHLWVTDEQRGAGIGTRLMRMAEHEGADRGAEHAHVDTYDFQALSFYERIGYSQFGVLRDYPPGHSRHFLQRDLV
jgi:GNAT superfamily N-acetyltransferase